MGNSRVAERVCQWLSVVVNQPANGGRVGEQKRVQQIRTTIRNGVLWQCWPQFAVFRCLLYVAGERV